MRVDAATIEFPKNVLVGVARQFAATIRRNPGFSPGDRQAMRAEPVSFEVVNNALVSVAGWMAAAIRHGPALWTGD